ncbi:glycosyltransferase [candidate division KSB1 bacterium]|nr:glycosyltransferase [candidate division KSB1 bacterium]
MKRPTKFIKYLFQQDWRVTGFTVPVDSYFLLDDKFIHELPAGTEIVRVRTLISKKRTDHFRIKSLKGTEVKTKNIKGLKNKLLWKIRDWFFIPDVQIGWIPFALPVAIKTVKRKKIDIIMTKCPPYSVLVLGALIKLFTGVPWVIDLADPWTTATYTYFPNPAIKRINEWLEKIIFKYADRIVTVTENIVDDYRIKYPRLDSDKFCVIPNGYDIDDHQAMNVAPFPKFTLSYTGRIDLAGRDPRHLIEAFYQFLSFEPDSRQHAQLLFVGGGGEYWQTMVKDNGMDDVVIFTGNVSHETCLSYQAASDVLLIIGGGSKYEQTGKIFEYLVADKPILALIRDDAPAARIISETRTGIVLPENDIKRIADAIHRFYQLYRSQEPLWTGRNVKEIEKYDWRNHGRRLAEIFNELQKNKCNL